MIRPLQAIYLLISACIGAGVCHVDYAAAQTAATSGQATTTPPKGPSPAAQRSRNTPAAQPLAPPLLTNPLPAKLPGRAYVFRGALGPIFSRGMDRLTTRIEQAGVTASVSEFTLCGLIAEQAIGDYRKDPAPIILIGHSMGGRCALEFAEKLHDEGIPVSLVVTIDPARAIPDVPLNVERFVNIFLSNNILGGGDVKPRQDFRGHYASFDLAEHDKITHINIDKQDAIHEQIVAKIRELATTPAKAENAPGQLRYVVPADDTIELWDSATPVQARSGDTLQTLAAFYRVPLWSLTQINQMAEETALTAGQRVVIPRHLLPFATAAAPTPLSGRRPLARR